MVVNPGLLLPRVRRLAGEHKLFTGALFAGAVLRLLAILGYPGALSARHCGRSPTCPRRRATRSSSGRCCRSTR